MVGNFEYEPQPEPQVGLKSGEVPEAEPVELRVRSIWMDQTGAEASIDSLEPANMGGLVVNRRYQDMQYVAKLLGQLLDGAEVTIEMTRADGFRSFYDEPGKSWDADFVISVVVEGYLSFQLELGDISLEAGSILSWFNERIKAIESSPLATTVVGGLIVAAVIGITAISIELAFDPSAIADEPAIEQQETQFYNCVNAQFISAETGFDGNLENAAIALLDNPNFGNHERAKLWASRQLCFKALGLYDDRIDGIPGQNTHAAEEAFAAEYAVRVDWTSRAFTEILIRRAASAMTHRAQLIREAAD